MLTRAGQAAAWRLRAAAVEARPFRVRLAAWLAFRRNISRYRVLDEVELRATRKSDTVFIFGSGASLNAISAAEWRDMEVHDTIGFNWFVRQNFVRCDYHLVREIGPTDLEEAGWRPHLEEYFRLARANPRYAKTIFLIQTGFRATNGNRAIGLGLTPSDRPVFLWRSIVGRDMPTRSLRDGLTHGHGTVNECVNFAFLLGWKRIVLAGVDLYDRRYFWLGSDEPRPDDPNTSVNAPHSTAVSGIVEGLGRWRAELEKAGVRLFIHNPQSLLSGTLPVWHGSGS